MSRYTSTINDIINHFLPFDPNSKDYDVWELVRLTHDKFFNFDYYFYTSDQKIKDDFEMNFLLRYLNDYIGYETLGMFKARLMSHLNINMYWYEKMYNAIMSGDNPFQNQSDTTTVERQLGSLEQQIEQINNEKNQSKKGSARSKNITKGKTTNTDNSQDIHSDNPQVTVKNTDYASSMNRATSTNVSDTSTDSTTSYGDSETIGSAEDNKKNAENNKQENERQKTEHTGLNGLSRADVIAKYSEQIYNLNKMLIDSCSTMFLKVW